MTNQANMAFVFPGQGSQKLGMLVEFEENEVFKMTFEEASETLGYDVWGVIKEGPQEKLNMTEITQPVLLACSVALWRFWRSKEGAQPLFMSGHSLGEWSALVCAGVLEYVDALNLVRARGRYMQEAVPEGQGAMAAIIGLDNSIVEDICQRVAEKEIVSPVNYNSPGQLVIAGSAAAVGRAIEACKGAGAKRALALPVSAPFHTSMMKPAAERLAEDIRDIRFSSPEIPIVHNVTAAMESNPDTIKQLIIEQIFSPVRWVECAQSLVKNGAENTVECGPGKVLTGLMKRIDKNVTAYSIDNKVALSDCLSAFAK